MKSKDVEFVPGDLVLMRVLKNKKGQCAKFADRFSGPYEISSRISVVNYVVKSLQSGKVETVHVNRLKGYEEEEVEKSIEKLFESDESGEEFEGFSTVSEESEQSEEENVKVTENRT